MTTLLVRQRPPRRRPPTPASECQRIDALIMKAIRAKCATYRDIVDHIEPRRILQEEALLLIVSNRLQVLKREGRLEYRYGRQAGLKGESRFPKRWFIVNWREK